MYWWKLEHTEQNPFPIWNQRIKNSKENKKTHATEIF